jgi:TonB family protein
MSSLTDVWKKWEGRVVDGKFPLRHWLGGSDHSAVFLTERSGNGSHKAAIKLISVDVFSTNNLDKATQLARWVESAKLSHPHLIQLFECGRGKIDDNKFLYVVMEYAEENLAQILPQRALSPEEVKDMLPPTAEALAFLHQYGFAHNHIKPANIMAVDNQLKISSDGLRKIGEPDKQAPGAYVAPEVEKTGPSPKADVWSLGAMLVATLTQQAPNIKNTNGGHVAVPESIPEPLRGIAERCLRIDPEQRCTVNEVLDEVLNRVKVEKPRLIEPTHERLPAKSKKPLLWLIVPIIFVIVLTAIWLGRKSHQSPASPAENSATQSSPAPAAQPSSPSQDQATSRGTAQGRVLQEVPPDVSPGARKTITGHIKVSVQVSVDTSGNVSAVRLVSAGRSKYFAQHALAATRGWKFAPPQVNGQPSPSEWILHFQFGRTSTQVSPTQTKP